MKNTLKNIKMTLLGVLRNILKLLNIPVTITQTNHYEVESTNINHNFVQSVSLCIFNCFFTYILNFN